MDVITEIETKYVVRLSRLEAARFLVDPKDVQGKLLDLLQPGNEKTEALSEGPVPTRLRITAPKPSDHLPATRRAMRRLRQVTQRVSCPHCGARCAKRGLGVHIARKHRRNGAAEAVPVAPVETPTEPTDTEE